MRMVGLKLTNENYANKECFLLTISLLIHNSAFLKWIDLALHIKFGYSMNIIVI